MFQLFASLPNQTHSGLMLLADFLPSLVIDEISASTPRELHNLLNIDVLALVLEVGFAFRP